MLLLLAVVLHWQPAGVGAGDFAARSGQFSREVTADSWFIVARVLGHASHVWLFMLFGVGYRVAVPQSRLSVTLTVAVLYLLFVGVGFGLSP